MEVFHCETGADNQMPLYRGPCFSDKRPYKTQVCKKVLAAWAMGADPFVYPEVSTYILYNVIINRLSIRNERRVTRHTQPRHTITPTFFLFRIFSQEAGLPIGGPDFNGYVMLEVHYNNPGLIKGMRAFSIPVFTFIIFFFFVF